MDSMNWYGRFPQGTKDKVAMNLVDRESRDRWKQRAYILLRLAKKFRREYVLWRRAWSGNVQSLQHRRHWSRTWKKAAKEFRSLSLELTREWEDERDRYQAMVEQRDHGSKMYMDKCEELNEAKAGHSKEIRRVVELEEFYYQACKQRDEAVERLLYFKELYEQGAPMTIAGMNMKIAELKDRNDRLLAVCKNTRAAIQAIIDKDAFYYFELMKILADISKALSNHIAREEADEQKTT